MSNSQILLVEGTDDQHVCWALFEKHNVPQTFKVIESKGINNLFEQLPVRFKQSDIKSIGIIIDADINLASRWQQLKGILETVGVVLPDNPEATGTIIEGQIRFGVWAMPDNTINGMLEDFIKFLIPEGDLLLPIAEATLASIEQQNLNKYSLAHKAKALIHTWLSWQEDPGTPLGLSITKRYLTTDAQICLSFIQWINKLYN